MLKLILLNAFYLLLCLCMINCDSENFQNEETPVCGGFIEFDEAIPAEIKKQIDYSSINVQLFTMDMILKDHTNLAASGYYFLPIYDNESFILKISGPNGMNFEPEQYVFQIDPEKSIKEICQKDINFKFRGYIVEGQVSTFGSNDGPEGITLVLVDQTEQKVQTTKTVEKGLFKFKPINPGSYVIKPLDDINLFDKNHNHYKFTVNLNASNFFERALIIRGFTVSGKVQAETEPLPGISTYIYAFNSTLTQNYNCDYGNVEHLNENAYKGLTPFCSVNTDKDGYFVFKNIPFGKFLVKPVYNDKYVSYDTHPETETFDVEHRDYKIEQPFQVNNFSIFGLVVNSKKNGIPNVTIKIDGQVKAITDVNGIYKLENLTPGNYDLEAQADDMFFEPLTNIKITAHIRRLPDLMVTDYKLCGKILIEATEYFSTAKRTVILQDANDKSSKKERRTITDNQGKYCFEVKPGTYHIKPVLTQDEKDSDLHLQPESYDLELIDRPLLDVNFYQSKVVISGKIKCISECEPDIKVKLISGKTDRVLSANVNEKHEFVFNDILSGQYRLAIIKPEWCWDQEDIQIKVQNTDVKNIDFTQSGYSLFYSSAHNVEIELANLEKKLKKKTILEKSKSKICLPFKGQYIVTPISCQQFKESVYHYNTDKLSKLELVPIKFKVKGLVKIDKNLREMFAKINITNFNINLKIQEQENNSEPKDSGNSNLLKAKELENPFDFFTRPNIKLIITPTIPAEDQTKDLFSKLLFMPKSITLDVKDSCHEDLNELTFTMKSGINLEGKINPPMDGVNLYAYNKETNELVASTVSSVDGKYKIGPLYTEYAYNIKALKDGYKIVPDTKNPNNFSAEKLSFLRVKILDTNSKPLSQVFLSLSSADKGFKINNSTNNEGYFDFLELYSGDYYIKPFFKEYKFEPSQKMVKILGGQHYHETLIAHRIAFSIYGKINNLNKERVEGLYIQALDEKSKQIQETAIDKNGEYRLKGLNPGHKYIIRVKIPASSSIEKALPANIPIVLGEKDATGIDFVVLQRPKKIDIRGYLNYTQEEDHCPFTKVQNTYVELIKLDEEEEEGKIVTKPINNACQFVYRNLENKKYNIKVFEKQGKMSPNPKLIYEKNIDLNDDVEINNGVKILRVDVENQRKNLGDNLSYSIYSPIFLILMVLSLLKFEWAMKGFNYMMTAPFAILSFLMRKKRKHR